MFAAVGCVGMLLKESEELRRKLASLQAESPEIWVHEGLQIATASGTQTLGNKILK